jgi:hypothetical protein
MCQVTIFQRVGEEETEPLLGSRPARRLCRLLASSGIYVVARGQNGACLSDRLKAKNPKTRLPIPKRGSSNDEACSPVSWTVLARWPDAKLKQLFCGDPEEAVGMSAHATGGTATATTRSAATISMRTFLAIHPLSFVVSLPAATLEALTLSPPAT